MSTTAHDNSDANRGTSLLPRDLTAAELAAVPSLTDVDALLIDDLTPDEDHAFAAALAE